MAKGALEFRDVAFFYPSAGAAVFDGLTVGFPPGWTGIIGANGSGKTTLLRLACGELTPTRGRVVSPPRVIYCAQRTDEPPDRLGPLVQATDRRASVLRGQLGIDPDWPARWPTLSHGERKRAQIAVALWQSPRVLAIDEPTNHIDLQARRLLGEALRGFRGIGLLVSHDRALLDAVCGQCLFIDPPGATMRPGGYTKAAALAEAEQAEARHARQQAKRDLARLQGEAAERRREASRADRRRSKRHLAPRDSNGRARIDAARVSGKDGQAGRVARQLDGRLQQAQDRLDAIRVTKQVRLGIDMSAARSRRNFLFRLPAGRIELGGGRQLEFPDLAMTPADRVALTGPNGMGKSTLVRHVVDRGDLPEGKLVYLAQEIDAAGAARVLSEARRLPQVGLGEVMTIVSCLGSRPERLLESDQPSPGEVRKLMLALGMARRPHLIVMDEPTNHLDLPSIECLESALAEVPCGLLLVSHDLRFLQRLTRTRWQISPGPADSSGKRFRLHVALRAGAIQGP